MGISPVTMPEDPAGIFQARVDDRGLMRLPSPLTDYLQECSARKVFVTSLDKRIAKIYPSTTWKKNLDVLAGLPDQFSATVSPETGAARAAAEFRTLLSRDGPSRDDLLRMKPRDFERFIAEVWSRLGYEVDLTKLSGDGGYDLIAVQRAHSNEKFLIECKRYAPSNKVGVGLVRALYGVKTAEKATKALLVTTSSYTRGAQEFMGSHCWELEGVDYDGIIQWTMKAAEMQRTVALSQRESIERAVSFVAHELGSDAELDMQGRILMPFALRRELELESQTVWLQVFKGSIEVFNRKVYEEMERWAQQTLSSSLEDLRSRGFV
jgi:HJR/Mrr/RecB family endonuclease